jgi:hypothetical protein
MTEYKTFALATTVILSCGLIANVVMAQMGCTAFGKQVAKTVIEESIAACLADHSDVNDFSMLKSICKWADDVDPLIQDLLSARQRGFAKLKSVGACGPDGGK